MHIIFLRLCVWYGLLIFENWFCWNKLLKKFWQLSRLFIGLIAAIDCLGTVIYSNLGINLADKTTVTWVLIWQIYIPMSSKEEEWKNVSCYSEGYCIYSIVCIVSYLVLIPSYCRGSNNSIFCFSINGTFVTGDNEGYVIVWNAHSKRRLLEVLSI